MDFIDDEYLSKQKCTPSSHQGAKQATSPDYKIEGLISLRRHGDDSALNEIQQCIGQISAWYGDIDEDGNKDTKGATGTVFKRLENGYYLVITCAHSLCRFNDATNEKESAKKVWYLPKGQQNYKIRLKCVAWIAHEDYTLTNTHCANDIAVILCYDVVGVYKNVKVNDYIYITAAKGKKKLKYCHIYGYPAMANGKLMGMIGDVMFDKDFGEWKYRNIFTYPGQSGSVIYKSRSIDDDDDKEQYHIYGVHTYGNPETQTNRGVCLSQGHIQWIGDKEILLKQRAVEHIKSRKEKEEEKKEPEESTEAKNEVQLFLESLDVAYCYWLLEEQGLQYMADLKFIDDAVLKEFGVNKYFDRKRILDGIKKHFDNVIKKKDYSVDDPGDDEVERSGQKHHVSTSETLIVKETERRILVSDVMHRFDEIIIKSNGTLSTTEWNGKSGGTLILETKTLVIEEHGSINLDGIGYKGGKASSDSIFSGESVGSAMKKTTGSNKGGGGGSMLGGGCGGYGTKGHAIGFIGGGKGGDVYGDSKLANLYLGSGGGNARYGGCGANGGGALKITAEKITIKKNASISCNGQNASSKRVGSGSGGSIHIMTHSIINYGDIYAKGGERGALTSAGGYGRIRIDTDNLKDIGNVEPNIGYTQKY